MSYSTRFLYSISAALIFLLFVTIGVVFNSVGNWSSLSQPFQFHVCASEPPPPPPVIRKFQPLTSKTSWESLLLPQNGGILKVRTSNNTVTDYGISMFHQLHCLTVLRGLIFPETTHHHGRPTTSPSHSGDAHEDAVHWEHCFDYIAQVSCFGKAIICAADDTIEPPRSAVDEDGKRVLIIDGLGHPHQCRDSELLWRAVQDSEVHPVELARVKGTVSYSEILLDN
ncbi:hypothetical protein BO82DRAFT_334788 [Aspergillus uvarum CBS 121591]|uniref:Uncharacterized protein n=1 Tax=Aspergillus uvarum CBS 121591 TaxID=1448315 RepID=A0A319CEZ9_9EURO|nr:hypothetical protein BO82DRAFT_334788 [Aspergillus uvarum CBS 121591]PYH81927.1 hypothetical protein BO82DRAFT_334788 [Aspergillus uvarum CBS 121591]